MISCHSKWTGVDGIRFEKSERPQVSARNVYILPVQWMKTTHEFITRINMISDHEPSRHLMSSDFARVLPSVCRSPATLLLNGRTYTTYSIDAIDSAFANRWINKMALILARIYLILKVGFFFLFVCWFCYILADIWRRSIDIESFLCVFFAFPFCVCFHDLVKSHIQWCILSLFVFFSLLRIFVRSFGNLLHCLLYRADVSACYLWLGNGWTPIKHTILRQTF